jgi:hypothetical protein
MSMNLIKKWTDHLKDNNMTYIQHLIFALFYGVCCLLAGLLLIIHSVFPCFFPTAGSNLVKKLSKRFSREIKK